MIHARRWLICVFLFAYLPPTTAEVYVFARAPAFVCLTVCVQDYSKRRAWIWIKCCVSTDVGTWTNWLTFEPDPDHSPDVRTGLLSPIAYALQRRILLRTRIGRPSQQWRVVLRRRNTVVGGKCALPSALLVLCIGRFFLRYHALIKYSYVQWLDTTPITSGAWQPSSLGRRIPSEQCNNALTAAWRAAHAQTYRLQMSISGP